MNTAVIVTLVIVFLVIPAIVLGLYFGGVFKSDDEDDSTTPKATDEEDIVLDLYEANKSNPEVLYRFNYTQEKIFDLKTPAVIDYDFEAIPVRYLEDSNKFQVVDGQGTIVFESDQFAFFQDDDTNSSNIFSQPLYRSKTGIDQIVGLIRTFPIHPDEKIVPLQKSKVITKTMVDTTEETTTTEPDSVLELYQGNRTNPEILYEFNYTDQKIYSVEPTTRSRSEIPFDTNEDRVMYIPNKYRFNIIKQDGSGEVLFTSDNFGFFHDVANNSNIFPEPLHRSSTASNKIIKLINTFPVQPKIEVSQEEEKDDDEQEGGNVPSAYSCNDGLTYALWN